MSRLHLLCIVICAGAVSEKLSPIMTATSLYTMIGHTETINCIYNTTDLSITYILLLNETTVEKRTMSENREASFNVTIYNETRLGPYKCKVNDSLLSPVYSQELTFTLQRRLLRPDLVPDSESTIIGNKETIVCISRNTSVPVTYTLFLNKTFVSCRTVSQGREAAFNVTIYDERSLGPYKCKADNNRTNATYSHGFTFTLKDLYSLEEKSQHIYLAWLIPVLILIGILMIIAYIGFTRYKKGRAGQCQEQYYEDVAVDRSGGSSADQDVEYCTVVVGGRTGAIMDIEESVEYTGVIKNRSGGLLGGHDITRG
ncbi:allergin-1 isoform X2 [Dendropsophus ebraccatus]|uniref:allergin-1 isoform X2 n=1 Tax=Dendropsophus ebraccatus TaxID=150705 RepID=UPI003831BE04